MSTNKPRHDPAKPQNNYGGDYECPCYDSLTNGTEFCHDEGQMPWWIEWAEVKDGKLVCKGNRHTCNKMRMAWLASQYKEE
jgi:hypothetical protein